MCVCFQHLSVMIMGLSTFLFCLFWQFNQFIMLLQAFALFGVWILDVVPARKVAGILFLSLSASQLMPVLLHLHFIYLFISTLI